MANEENLRQGRRLAKGPRWLPFFHRFVRLTATKNSSERHGPLADSEPTEENGGACHSVKGDDGYQRRAFIARKW